MCSFYIAMFCAMLCQGMSILKNPSTTTIAALEQTLFPVNLLMWRHSLLKKRSVFATSEIALDQFFSFFMECQVPHQIAHCLKLASAIRIITVKKRIPHMLFLLVHKDVFFCHSSKAATCNRTFLYAHGTTLEVTFAIKVVFTIVKFVIHIHLSNLFLSFSIFNLLLN